MNTNSEVRSAATPGEPVERGQDQASQGAGVRSFDKAVSHTPGPWQYAPTNSGHFIRSVVSPGYLAEVRHVRTTQDVAADARLIAAAPELLEELLRARRLLVSEGYAPAATMDIAIAKATQP